MKFLTTFSGGFFIRIVIIGGTGLPDIGDGSDFSEYGLVCENNDDILVDTKFGSVPMIVQDYSVNETGTAKLFFLNRHHSSNSESTPPHMISHRANISAVVSCKPDIVVSICSVGAVNMDFPPGMVGLAKQYVDFTGIVSTFFDDNAVHTSVTNPFDSELNTKLIEILKSNQSELFGEDDSRYYQTYWMTSGPQYETPAEISAIRKLGGTCVGMTLSSEAKLMAEADLRFSAICISSNWAAGADSLDPNADLHHEKISAKAKDKLDSVWHCIATLIIDE